jgi:hypothetical protein
VPLHDVCPVGHAHWPPWQTCPPVHVVPQFPQLLLSVWVFVQAPLQQVCPAGQVLPHSPQLFGSEARSTHSPKGNPQQVDPPEQQLLPHSCSCEQQELFSGSRQVLPSGQQTLPQTLSQQYSFRQVPIPPRT